jgi:hypothetical protein
MVGMIFCLEVMVWSGSATLFHGRASVHLRSDLLLPCRNVNRDVSESSAYSPSVEPFAYPMLARHGESGARARLAFRISSEIALQSVAPSMAQDG